jgi:hypothetical protein
MLLNKLHTPAFVAILLIASCAMPAWASGKSPRSSAMVLAFKRANPCPSTGARGGTCPGYVIDHVEPLCAGGKDDPSNMQWQELAESKIKDAEERRRCRALKSKD